MAHDCKVYVGDLPRDASEQVLEREFGHYGRLRKVWVARNPPGFAFVEFEDPRDADDAIRALDGQHLFGGRIRVELSNGKSKVKPWQRDGRGGGGGGRGPPRYDPYRSSRNGRSLETRDRYKYEESGYKDYRDGGSRRRSRSRSPRESRNERRRSRTKSRSKSRSPAGDVRRSRSPSRE